MPLTFFKIFLPAVSLACVTLGLYLIALWLGVETVSWLFLLGFPAIAGFIIMWFRPQNTFKTFGASLAWLIGTMWLSVALSLISGLEGMICVAMALFPIIIGTLIGGLLYLLVLRWRGRSQTRLMAVTLPLIALGLLGLAPVPPQTYTISNTVLIDAPPALVFEMLKTIPDIAPDEVPTRASHLLGVPKPSQAIWEERFEGAIRHSYWGDGVRFDERITAFEQGRRIAWDFEFPEGWIEEGIEDPHITVGGRYFDVLSGEYRLEDLGGKTRLTLTTWTYDSSRLGRYAKFWHVFFFDDFHETILTVVKSRAEARAQSVTGALTAGF